MTIIAAADSLRNATIRQSGEIAQELDVTRVQGNCGMVPTEM